MEKVTIVGPKGEMAASILGPVRKEDQIEVSLTEARKLGIAAPVRESGDIEGTPVIFEATQNGNDLVFDEFIFNKAINLYGVDIELNITVNMTGVLENDVLTLDGTASGTGVVKVLGINVNVNLIDGTITGELEKEE